jgi:serine/threonine protein kinase
MNGLFSEEEELGRGAYGVVYLLKNTQTRELFALKKIDKRSPNVSIPFPFIIVLFSLIQFDSD